MQRRALLKNYWVSKQSRKVIRTEWLKGEMNIFSILLS